MSFGYPVGQLQYQPSAAGVQLYAQQQQHPSVPGDVHRYQDYGQPSQCYGSYGSFYNNAFQTNAYQAYQFQSPNDLWEIFVKEMSKNPANGNRQAIQAEDLCNILNNTPSIRNFYGINWSRELC
ncbi:uncharacterized protein LOC135481702, partial [Liolophura sinensis]|uniref:uncharacterized protein LOC135481702 n=1 Tax=Liolophura sinensis TaxID=3198878 RepID=UPI00315829D7